MLMYLRFQRWRANVQNQIQPTVEKEGTNKQRTPPDCSIAVCVCWVHIWIFISASIRSFHFTWISMRFLCAPFHFYSVIHLWKNEIISGKWHTIEYSAPTDGRTPSSEESNKSTQKQEGKKKKRLNVFAVDVVVIKLLYGSVRGKTANNGN